MCFYLIFLDSLWFTKGGWLFSTQLIVILMRAHPAVLHPLTITAAHATIQTLLFIYCIYKYILQPLLAYTYYQKRSSFTQPT